MIGPRTQLLQATHGFASAANPLLSRLLLTPENTTSTEDGVLHLGEVYNLRLNADLVVLSACETGLGPLARGEGIIGLTRGFLYAGAQSVVVSLWQASDAVTPDLMVDFYRAVLEDRDHAAALRSSKLAMLSRSDEASLPYYWAPFILVGR